jgi:transcriptional regulator with XRE-family HTH domain
MSTTGSRRRGRPAKPTDHPVGARVRLRREQLGLTVRDAALRAGLKRSSASYLSQLESGAKTPHPALARRLAEALDDDPRIYLAWSATGRRSDPLVTARAVRTLAELLRHPGYDLSPAGPGSPEPGMRETPGDLAPLRAVPDARPAARVPALEPRPSDGGVPSAKLLVPELEEGADPGDGSRAPRPLAMHRIAAGALGAVEPLLRPFAYRLSAAGARRVRDLLAPGDVAVLTRRVWPPEPAAPCAVRLSGHVVLARILWNERQLLLLPGPGECDFIVLDAPDRTTVERLLAGRVAATLRPAD